MLFQWRVIPPVPPLLTEHVTGDLQGTPLSFETHSVCTTTRVASGAPADLRVQRRIRRKVAERADVRRRVLQDAHLHSCKCTNKKHLSDGLHCPVFFFFFPQ